MAASPEEVISEFRRLKPKPKTNKELEMRLQKLVYAVWLSIFNGLLEKKIPVDDGVITQVINVIMDEKTASRGDAKLTAQRIRQIVFVDGKKVSDTFVRKLPVMAPARVSVPHAPPYTIVLSEESPDPLTFDSNEGVLIRVKLRAGFTLRQAGAGGTHVWRIDMSAVRQLTGAEATTALPAVKAAMFQAGTTARTMPAVLALHDPLRRAAYRFEGEVEYLGGEQGAGGASLPLTVSDLTAAASQIAHLAAPQHVETAEYQAALYDVAKIVYAKSPGMARKFEREFGLKRLTPQVTVLTRGDYRAMFPPVGMLATEKRDGMRCIVSARDDRAVLLADKLYSFERKTAASAATAITVVDAEFTAPDIVDIFDVIVVDGKDVSAQGLEARITHAEAAAKVLRAYGIKAVAKPYMTLTKENMKEVFSRLAADDTTKIDTTEGDAKSKPKPKAVSAEVRAKDGIILAKPGQPYTETESYKWKPTDQEGIDFLARRCPKGIRGQEPFVDRPGFELHFLFNGINTDLYAALALRPCPGYDELFGRDARVESYFPIQFQPSNMPMAYLYWHPTSSGPIDGKIVDLRPGSVSGGAPKLVIAKAADARAADAKTADAKSVAAKNASKPATAASKPAASSKTATASSKTATASKTAAPPLPHQFVNWVLMRVRHDREGDQLTGRYFGNDYRVAELTWLNTIDPFPVEQLWGEEDPTGSSSYFAREKTGIYKAQTAFISYVKTQRIETLRHSNVVVELCSGAGADVGRFMSADIRSLIAVEQDRGAAAEMLRRKYSHIKRRQESRSRGRRTERYDAGASRPGRGMAMSMIIADVSRPFAETAALIRRAAGIVAGPVADGVVMNLALHYFMGSVESMRNIAALCIDIVKIEGTVSFTAMFGAAVHALFQEHKIAEGASWDVRRGAETATTAAPSLQPTARGVEDGSVLQYSLKRMYKGDTLTAAGQKIGVLLPFSNGKYYEEYLVNVRALETEFHARGFKTVIITPMSKYFDTFQAHNPNVASELTADDRKYVSLYGEIVFRRYR